MKLDTAAFQFLLFFRKYPVFGLLDLEDETTMILQNTGDYLPINMVNIPEDVCVREREREGACACVLLTLHAVSQEQFVPYFCVTFMPFQCTVLFFNLQLK